MVKKEIAQLVRQGEAAGVMLTQSLRQYGRTGAVIHKRLIKNKKKSHLAKLEYYHFNRQCALMMLGPTKDL